MEGKYSPYIEGTERHPYLSEIYYYCLEPLGILLSLTCSGIVLHRVRQRHPSLKRTGDGPGWPRLYDTLVSSAGELSECMEVKVFIMLCYSVDACVAPTSGVGVCQWAWVQVYINSSLHVACFTTMAFFLPFYYIFPDIKLAGRLDPIWMPSLHSTPFYNAVSIIDWLLTYTFLWGQVSPTKKKG